MTLHESKINQLTKTTSEVTLHTNIDDYNFSHFHAMERLSKKSSGLPCLIRGIFLYTQVSGFSPFAFDTVKQKVVRSKAWVLYSTFFTITLSSITVFYLQLFSELSMINKKFNIFYVVKSIDIYGNSCIMIISLIIQIYNNQKLIDTINSAIVIRKNLRYLSPNEGIFAKSFWKHFRRVSLILLVQCILYVLFCFESWTAVSESNTYFQFFLSRYYHWGISIIVVKIFYHSGMMIGIRLYEIVNDRISEILGSIVMEKKSEKYLFVTEVDQCDHLILIFGKITNFTKSVNQLFSTQIMFVIFGCFMCILTSVSI